MSNKSTIVLDLDGTLTVDDNEHSYPDKLVQNQVKFAAIAARRAGYLIHIHTARNMRTYSGNLQKILDNTKPICEKWLDDNEIEYDALTFGKPWSGVNGCYVDDKGISIEEFIFKFNGPLRNKTVDIIIPFYNEHKNVERTHLNQKKLDRLFHINNFIYVDNGSSDQTNDALQALANQDVRVKILTLGENRGYGFGMWEGIKSSSSDCIITNHADNQFDTYGFIHTNMDKISEDYDASRCIVSKRVNRCFTDQSKTWVLTQLVSLFRGQRYPDFNGQPKIMPRNVIMSMKNVQYDFCFDLAVVDHLHLRNCDILSLPIVEIDRKAGHSSWKGDYSKTFRIVLRYVLYLITSRKV